MRKNFCATMQNDAQFYLPVLRIGMNVMRTMKKKKTNGKQHLTCAEIVRLFRF